MAGRAIGPRGEVGDARRLPSGRAGGAGWSRAGWDETAQRPDLQRYWQIIRSRRTLAASVFLAVSLGVALGTLLQTPVYRATGTMEIRKQGGEVLPVEALFELARISDQHMQTQYGVLRSPTLARRVIAELDLMEADEFAPSALGRAFGRISGAFSFSRDPESALAESPDAAMEPAVRRFLQRLSVEPVQDSRLVEVSFEAEDPELAARVVNAVFSSYLALRAEIGRAAVARLAEQVDSVRNQLAVSELELQEFVRGSELLLVESADGDTQSLLEARLGQLQEQLTDAEAEYYAIQARYGEVRGESRQALGSRVVETLAVPLAELEAEYAKLRATFTDSFPRVREVKRQIEALQAQVGVERTRIASEVSGEYRAAGARVGMLRQAFEEQKELADQLAAHSAEYRILKREVEGHEQLYALLQQKEKEADVSAAMVMAEAGVVDAAVPPSGPVRPSPRRSLPLGALAGLLLGVGAAFLREHTDSTVRRVEELDSLSVPVLALIPSVGPAIGRQDVLRVARGTAAAPLLLPSPAEPGDRMRAWARIDREGLRRSALAEAFGGLRTSVLFAGMQESARDSLMVTSVQPGEGKTTVSMNLAISLAHLGRRVLLVDADLRRPALHRAFGFSKGPGLAEYLEGRGSWEQMARTDGVAGLSILTAGGPADAPAELLCSARMQALLDQARADYDFVIVDTPALMVNVADARILSAMVDGIILVARNGVTPRDALRRLAAQTPNVVGVVLNDLDASHMPGYYHEYMREDDQNTTRMGGVEVAHTNGGLGPDGAVEGIGRG